MSGVDDRIKQLEIIRKTVRKYENQVNHLLQEIGWTKDKLPLYKEEQTEATKCESIGSSSKESIENTAVASQPTESIDLETVVNIGQKIDAKRSSSNNFTDLNKLQRDLKRRRVKYRTTKTAPLTYTEQLRELITLQMELVTEQKDDE